MRIIDLLEMANFTVPKSKGLVRDEAGTKLRDMNIGQLEPNVGGSEANPGPKITKIT